MRSVRCLFALVFAGMVATLLTTVQSTAAGGPPRTVVPVQWVKLKGFAGSPPIQFTNLYGSVIFQGNDGTHGFELWKTDGTAAGTVLVRDLYPGITPSLPNGFRGSSSGNLLFSASGTNLFGLPLGYELWQTDGTYAGTSLVKDINAGGNNSFPAYLTALLGTVYFSADDGAHGTELWKSDGTPAGTVMVKDINPTGSSNPYGFQALAGKLYFAADDGVNGVELWRTDGTLLGTTPVANIAPGAGAGSFPRHLTLYNGALYFSANDGTHGNELWATDGTTTVLFKDIWLGGTNSDPDNLTVMNGRLYFTAGDGTYGTEVWKTDGTAGGTAILKDINPGATLGSYPASLVAIVDTLYFTANDGTHGRELWKSNGTTAGTVLVADIVPGTGASTPSMLSIVNGRLFFGANDGTHGSELWTSDGTIAGTVMLPEIRPGSLGSLDDALVDVEGVGYFGATDGTESGLYRTNASLPDAAFHYAAPTALAHTPVTLSATVRNTHWGPLSRLTISDTLPANVVVANTPNASNTCGGTLTAAPGAALFSVQGGSLGINATCTLSVDVVGTAPGMVDGGTAAVSTRETGASTADTTTLLNVLGPLFLPHLDR